MFLQKINLAAAAANLIIQAQRQPKPKPSCTTCAECQVQIPPGKPGRRCKPCQAVAAARETVTQS